MQCPKGAKTEATNGLKERHIYICPYIVSEIISSDLDESQKTIFSIFYLYLSRYFGKNPPQNSMVPWKLGIADPRQKLTVIVKYDCFESERTLARPIMTSKSLRSSYTLRSITAISAVLRVYVRFGSGGAIVKPAPAPSVPLHAISIYNSCLKKRTKGSNLTMAPMASSRPRTMTKWL